MSVIKNLRNVANSEYYKQALRIRQRVTLWMLRDFGMKKYPRSVAQVIKNISVEDQKIIDDIFIKYGRNPKKTFESSYPYDFIICERNYILKVLQSLQYNILKAETAGTNSNDDIKDRIKYQSKAIDNCLYLFQELQYIVSIVTSDLNQLVLFLEDIDHEISLLSEWKIQTIRLLG